MDYHSLLLGNRLPATNKHNLVVADRQLEADDGFLPFGFVCESTFERIAASARLEASAPMSLLSLAFHDVYSLDQVASSEGFEIEEK